MGIGQEAVLLPGTPALAACVFSCETLSGSAGDVMGGDDVRKMWGEVGKTVSGECDVMGPYGVTGGVGGDTAHLLEDNLCNSPTPEVLMSKEHRRGGRSLHLKGGIQVQVQMEPQT